MSLATLRLFGAVRQTDVSKLPVLVKEYGVLISASAAYEHKTILQYLKVYGVGEAERNSSFWESWSKVKNASDFTLLAEQIVHYLTTYGLESLGIDAVKNGFIYLPEKVFVRHEPVVLKWIDVMPTQDLARGCFRLLESGIALADQTLQDIIAVLTECEYQITGEERIKNKEAQVLFYKLSGKLPTDGETLFRYLVYHFSDQTLVINNKDLRGKITASGRTLPDFTHTQETELAKSFNRHKDLWMAMKKANKSNIPIVNSLTRLSKNFHVPMMQNPLNTLTMAIISPRSKGLAHAIENGTVGQLVRAYNAVYLREQKPSGSVYRIRNGKQWTKLEPPNSFVHSAYKQVLLHEMKRRVGKTKVYIEPFVDFAFPVSEKSFVGNIPDGTILRFPQTSKNLLIGVHWDDPYTDLDFRADSAEFSLGWNSGLRHSNKGLMHSGDMTRAPAPYGATEWIYAAKVDSTYQLKLNLYSGSDFSKHFKLIVGVSNQEPNGNKQIPPEDIVFATDIPMPQKQMSIGTLYTEGEMTCLRLSIAGTGKSNVGRYSKLDAVQNEVFAKQTISMLRLKDVVSIADQPGEGIIDLSLSVLNKSKFMFEV